MFEHNTPLTSWHDFLWLGGIDLRRLSLEISVIENIRHSGSAITVQFPYFMQRMPRSRIWLLVKVILILVWSYSFHFLTARAHDHGSRAVRFDDLSRHVPYGLMYQPIYSLSKVFFPRGWYSRNQPMWKIIYTDIVSGELKWCDVSTSVTHVMFDGVI
jgi:hypothetical protein